MSVLAGIVLIILILLATAAMDSLQKHGCVKAGHMVIPFFKLFIPVCIFICLSVGSMLFVEAYHDEIADKVFEAVSEMVETPSDALPSEFTSNNPVEF